MANGKSGRPRTDSVKLHLALPKPLGQWVTEKSENHPFCSSRQEFIVGVLEQVRKKEIIPEQMELDL